MNFNIALLRGDGIGPEIVDSAVAVLKKVAEKYGHTFQFTPYLIGGCAIDATGVPLPQETMPRVLPMQQNAMAVKQPSLCQPQHH